VGELVPEVSGGEALRVDGVPAGEDALGHLLGVRDDWAWIRSEASESTVLRESATKMSSWPVGVVSTATLGSLDRGGLSPGAGEGARAGGRGQPARHGGGRKATV
jgi:hypothetical protein